MRDSFNDFVLADTLWEFIEQPDYASRSKFEDAVRRYHAEVHEYAAVIRPAENWQPATIVLKSSRVVVEYSTYGG